MIDLDLLGRHLAALGLDDWAASLGPRLTQRLSPAGHGDFDAWQEVLDVLDVVADEVSHGLGKREQSAGRGSVEHSGTRVAKTFTQGVFIKNHLPQSHRCRAFSF